jgi:phage shock protein C
MQGKRLLRGRSDRVIAGVASGLAAYFNTDPLFIRLGFLLLLFLNGTGGILYLVLWLLIPNEDSAAADTRAQVRENVSEMQSTAESLAQRVRDMFNH